MPLLVTIAEQCLDARSHVAFDAVETDGNGGRQFLERVGHGLNIPRSFD
jgi:hypothetical protein